jgi:Ice-binding-like
MNHLQKHFSASLIALAALLSAAPMAWAHQGAQTAPSLGTASTFTILSAAPNAGGAVTCTDGSIIGDVGSSGPMASVVQTSCPISGAIIAPVSAQVVADFNTAYSQVANIPCGSTISGNLAGQTLKPGVYCVNAASTTTTGTLTLSGSATDTWTFIIGVRNADGTLSTGALTGTNFNVVMANGRAVPCAGVTWYVAQAATMTDSNFVGTVLAGAAISMTRGTFNGDALATAAVTVTGTAVTGCTATQPTACDGDHDGHDGGHDGHDGSHDGHDGHHDGHDGHHDGHDKERCDNGQHNGHDKDPFGSNDEHGDKGDK